MKTGKHIPDSYYLDSVKREYRIKNDAGEITRPMLDAAWVELYGLPPVVARAALRGREDEKQNLLFERLEALYRRNGWTVPSVKSVKEIKRAQIHNRIAAMRQQKQKQVRARPSLCQMLGAVVRGVK